MSYSSRRKENQVRNYSHENQALDEIAKEAEARLAAKRAARIQGREMRQKELSRHNSVNSKAAEQQDATPSCHTQSSRQNQARCQDAKGEEMESEDEASQSSCTTDSSHSNPAPGQRKPSNDIPSPPIRVALVNGILPPEPDEQYVRVSPRPSVPAMSQNNGRPETLGVRRNSAGPNPNSNTNNNNNYALQQQYSETHPSPQSPPPPTKPQNGHHSEDDSPHDLLQRLQDVEGLFKGAMVSNAQLSNELDSLRYQLEAMLDDFDDLNLKNAQIERDKKRQHKELLLLRKDYEVTNEELARAKEQIQKRDQLIQNSDMVILDVDGELTFASKDQTDHASSCGPVASPYYRRPYPASQEAPGGAMGDLPQVLITKSTLKMLKEFADLHQSSDSLDTNLRKLIDARLGLEDTVCDLKRQVREQMVSNERNAELLKRALEASEIEKNRNAARPDDRKNSARIDHDSSSFRDRETQTEDVDIKETRRKLLEYEYKLQRYEQELSTMAANLERAEANSLRQKSGLEAVEASEAEIKAENRRLKRELREATQNVAELTTKVGHLERRLEKMRTSRLNAVIAGNSQ